VLIVVDAQNAYKHPDSMLKLPGIAETLPHLEDAIAAARSNGTPVVHILHESPPGTPFDPATLMYQPIDEANPKAEEDVVVKTMADAFAMTNLSDVLAKHGRKEVIIIGYMTHNCVDATARSAVHHGIPTTIIAKACCTRDLPRHDGNGVIDAETLHHAVLTGLSDALLSVVQTVKDIA